MENKFKDITKNDLLHGFYNKSIPKSRKHANSNGTRYTMSQVYYNALSNNNGKVFDHRKKYTFNKTIVKELLGSK